MVFELLAAPIHHRTQKEQRAIKCVTTTTPLPLPACHCSWSDRESLTHIYIAKTAIFLPSSLVRRESLKINQDYLLIVNSVVLLLISFVTKYSLFDKQQSREMEMEKMMVEKEKQQGKGGRKIIYNTYMHFYRRPQGFSRLIIIPPRMNHCVYIRK